jgi:hypothetical protein
LSSLDQAPAGPGIDDLVKSGFISQREIDNARQMRGTPAYESFRNDPQYAGVMKLLEGERGLYSLREATGALKLQAAEAHRKAYFSNLEHYLEVGFFSLLFLSPFFLLIYYSRPGAGINPQALAERQTLPYVGIAGSLYNHLAVLTLLPLVCYPVGFLLLGLTRVIVPAWVLLALEAAVVLLIVLLQYVRIAKAQADNPKSELAPLRLFLWAFLGQFVASRAGFALMIFHPATGEDYAVFWFFASLIAPVVVVGSLSSHAH